LQFVIHGTPCYEVDINSGEALEYGDEEESPTIHSLAPEDYKSTIEIIRSNIGTLPVKKPLSLVDVQIALLYMVIGILFAIGFLGHFRVGSSSLALQTVVFEQEEMLMRLEAEERFLEYGLLDTLSGSFEINISDLNVILNHGNIMSVRFIGNTMELIMRVDNEDTMSMVIMELEYYYVVESYEIETFANYPLTDTAFIQYRVVLNLFQ